MAPLLSTWPVALYTVAVPEGSGTPMVSVATPDIASPSARWEPRLDPATEWISSTMTHRTDRKISRAREVSIR